VTAEAPTILDLEEAPVGPGEARNINLKVSESYTGTDIVLPMRMVRGQRAGPRVFVTGAIHGDELNGAGIIREVILGENWTLEAGTLILVPVVNVLGFERHIRYMPDRRDLNRSFPGHESGSLTARFAYTIFEQIVKRCDCGIDLHTAARGRTNFPNVRADLGNAEVKTLAESFGCEVIVDGTGPEGSLRRTACMAGCPTIILEGGEVMKIERTVVQVGVRGVRNVLSSMGMLDGQPRRPAYQELIERTTWIRASAGGICQFHVAPGDIVDEGQALATTASLLGENQRLIESPTDGVVLGMTTMPAVKPGDPVFHVAVLPGGSAPVREALEAASKRSIHHRVRSDLATNIDVSDPETVQDQPPG